MAEYAFNPITGNLDRIGGGSSGGGDVTGPSSSVSGNIVLFGDNSGKVIVDSGLSPDDFIIAEYFSAYLSSPMFNVTGDGTLVVIPFDGIINNSSSSYNPGTGIYTCSTPGVYIFSTTVCFSGGDASNDGFLSLFEGSTFAVRNFQTGGFTPSNATLIFSSSTPPINMGMGDTMKVTALVSGSGSKNVSLYGAAPVSYATTCTFGGYRLAS